MTPQKLRQSNEIVRNIELLKKFKEDCIKLFANRAMHCSSDYSQDNHDLICLTSSISNGLEKFVNESIEKYNALFEKL